MFLLCLDLFVIILNAAGLGVVLLYLWGDEDCLQKLIELALHAIPALFDGRTPRVYHQQPIAVPVRQPGGIEDIPQRIAEGVALSSSLAGWLRVAVHSHWPLRF
jgi:hypothetical protein